MSAKETSKGTMSIRTLAAVLAAVVALLAAGCNTGSAPVPPKTPSSVPNTGP